MLGPALGAANGEQAGSDDASTKAATRHELDRPMRIVLRPAEGDRIHGEVFAYDDRGLFLNVAGDDNESRHVRWTRLKPVRVYAIQRKLIDTRDANAWLKLGALLHGMPEGEALADRALSRAEKLDPSLEPKVQAVREGESLDSDDATGKTDNTASDGRERGGSDGGDDDGKDDGKDDADDKGASPKTSGPKNVGQVKKRFWGDLSAEKQKKSITSLKKFAERGLNKIGVPMRTQETEFFLLYTDLPLHEARRWAVLMDRMYNRLSELFGVPEGKNIWRGKALVLIFNNKAGYQRFEAEVHGSPAVGTAGRCWSFGSGEVHITFYRQPSDLSFAHVLVHESVHGFLHRYRSPQRIPSWINEGLAETIARELVPQSRTVGQRQHQSLRILRHEGEFHGMFELPHIDGWHYGLASSLTEYMIRQNKKGYVQFINGIKDGTPWRESLRKNYGTSLDRLIDFWAEQNHVHNVEP